jgi:hypothetical protein
MKTLPQGNPRALWFWAADGESGMPAMSGLRAVCRRWWQGLWADDLTRFLSQATDHVDLDRLVRRWNEVERRDRTPLL